MPIAPEHVGSYTIVREIGRGGMGVVYLGRDTKLDRLVAIKSLPPDLEHDEDRLTRFEREARTLASLSHPNIAGIYALEEHDGQKYLVLEYVEGETLDDRLDGGALPMDESLEICAQIAAGVEAAHDAGVVHRDLKPGNVMITTDGAVKVLDFGLARTNEASGTSSIAGPEQPTVGEQTPRSPTVPGAILGTAPYMSPEQARGRKVDHRSDLWSFGVILYECLSGVGPFVGETVSDSIGAILHAEPDWSRLPADTPPTVQLLLRRCLQRDRKRRLQSMGDGRIELETAIEDPTSGSMLTVGAIPGRPGRRRGLAFALTALALIAVGVAAGWLARAAPAPTPTTHLGVPIPDNFDSVLNMDLSPDGRTLAVAAEIDDESAIYVRDLGADDFRKLPGTEGAFSVRFSPGGGRLFFGHRNPTNPSREVRSIAAAGGPVLTAYRSPQIGLLGSLRFAPLGNDEVLAISQDGQELYRVQVPEGEPRRVTTFDWTRDSAAAAVSVPRGDGRFAVITRVRVDLSDGTRHGSLVRVDLETGQTMLLVDDAFWSRFVEPGGMVFRRGDNLFYTPFDLDRCEVTGSARACLTGVSRVRIARTSSHLVYRPQEGDRDQALVVAVDASGRVEPLMSSPGNYWMPRVSPEGQRIAYVAGSGASDDSQRIWVLDLGSGLSRPVTPAGAVANWPGWMPDGRLAYTRYLGTRHQEIVLLDPNTGAVSEPILPEPDGQGTQMHPVFSPDGQHVLFGYTGYDGREPGIYTMRLGDPRSMRPFYATPVIEGANAFSPNAQWVAYHTNGSGRFEVYLRAFDPDDPGRTPIQRVSSSGGMNPIWSRDGGTLYYFRGPEYDQIVAVTIETEPELSISEPRVVLRSDDTTVWGPFDTLPATDRFVMISRPGQNDPRSDEIRIILNWLAGLDQ